MRSGLPAYASYPYMELPYQEPSMHCIIQPVDGRGGLWLGNLASAKNRSGLDQRGIGAVLTVMSDKEVSFDNSIVQLFVRADDADFQQLNFTDAIDFIEIHRERTNVLVHCYAGVSRSTSMVVGMRFRYSKISLPYEKVQYRNAIGPLTCSKYSVIKTIVHPNPGFLRQLQRFEERICDSRRPASVGDFDRGIFQPKSSAPSLANQFKYEINPRNETHSYQDLDRMRGTTSSFNQRPSQNTPQRIYDKYDKYEKFDPTSTDAFIRNSRSTINEIYSRYSDISRSMNSTYSNSKRAIYDQSSYKVPSYANRFRETQGNYRNKYLYS